MDRNIETLTKKLMNFISFSIIGFILILIFSIFLPLWWNSSISSVFPGLIANGIIKAKISFFNALGLLGVIYTIGLAITYFSIFKDGGNK